MLEFVFTLSYIFSLNSVSAICVLLIHHTGVFSINYSVRNRRKTRSKQESPFSPEGSHLLSHYLVSQFSKFRLTLSTQPSSFQFNYQHLLFHHPLLLTLQDILCCLSKYSSNRSTSSKSQRFSPGRMPQWVDLTGKCSLTPSLQNQRYSHSS